MELREELWIAHLGKEASLTLESSMALWVALCTQIEQRLLAGEQIDFRPLGILSLVQEGEYIAHLPGEKFFLVPPRLKLEILSDSFAQTSQPITTLASLQPALTLSTSVRPDSVLRYLDKVIFLMQEYLDRGEEFSLPNLGSLVFDQAEGLEQTLGLRVSDNLAIALNKPFAMFTPVEVLDIDNQQDIEVRTLDTLPDSLQGYWLRLSKEKIESSLEIDANQDPDGTEIVRVNSPLEEQKASIIPSVDQHHSRSESERIDQTDIIVEDTNPSLEDNAFTLGLWGKVLAVCLVLGVLVAVYYRYGIGTRALSEDIPKIVRTTSISSDTLVTQDSTRLIEGVATTSISGADTIVLRKGDRLTKIAKEKYGHKVFWVYIYKHNKAVIKNPNNIPIGTQLILPPAQLYNIDAEDTNSRTRALELEKDIWLHKGQIQ